MQVKISIVGAGISGLATAQAILSRNPQADIDVFESDQRVGGKVWTEISPEGFICEGGVNGFLNKIPRTLELCEEIGLELDPRIESSQLLRAWETANLIAGSLLIRTGRGSHG